MTSDVKIDQAFLKQLVDANLGYPIAHENEQYKPTAETFLEAILINNDVTPFSLKRTDENDGVFRVIIHAKLDEGGIEAKEIADEIFALYPIGSVIQYDGVRVIITGRRRDRYAGVTANSTDRYRLTLTIRYRAFLRRN